MTGNVLESWPTFDYMPDLADFVDRASLEGAVGMRQLVWSFLPKQLAWDETFDTTGAQEENEELTDRQKGALKTTNVPQKVQKVVYTALVNELVHVHSNQCASNEDFCFIYIYRSLLPEWRLLKAVKIGLGRLYVPHV